jgi:hypothetical protein
MYPHIRPSSFCNVLSALQAVCWLLALTAAIAAIGLGGGNVSAVGQIVRSGFAQAKGANIQGTPAS